MDNLEASDDAPGASPAASASPPLRRFFFVFFSPSPPNATSRFAGFTSRWPMPRACVNAMPSRVCRNTSRSIRRPSELSRARNHHGLGPTTRKKPPRSPSPSFSFSSPALSVYMSDARDSPSSLNTSHSSVSAAIRPSPGMSSNADSYRATCSPPAPRSVSPKYASRRPERRMSSPRSTKTRFSTTLSPPRPTARARHTSPKCPRAKGARSVGTYPSPAAPDRLGFADADAPSFVPAGTASMGAAPTAPMNRVTTALDARGISISALARASGPGASARRRAATPSRPRATMPSSSSHPSASPADRASNSAESSSPGASARLERYTSGQFGQRDTGLARGITSSSENARSHAFSRPTQASPDRAMVAGRRIEPG
mmetsp:Transcript_2475/g.9684  ORF Transcript_2475/g.9684 Transcript_2475/m.9684 type:complete len:373 (+) Transcript_2475:758-1876(+)